MHLSSKFSWKIPAAQIISSIVVVSNEHILVSGGMYPTFPNYQSRESKSILSLCDGVAKREQGSNSPSPI